jgi:hypothetical protein
MIEWQAMSVHVQVFGSGHPDVRCPQLRGGLNRSLQHFILEEKDGVWDGTEIS